MSKNKNFSETTTSRYSLALFELADEENIVKEIEDQSQSLVNLISKNEDLKFYIKSPTNNKHELEGVIKKISEQFNINKLLKKFLCFLVFKRRFFYVEKILKNFIETCSKKRGEIKAELTTSKELNNAEIEDIKNDLSKSFNSKINLSYKKDKNLVGGLVLQVGSTMIDTSIKNKLQKLEKQMIEA